MSFQKSRVFLHFSWNPLGISLGSRRSSIKHIFCVLSYLFHKILFSGWMGLIDLNCFFVLACTYFSQFLLTEHFFEYRNWCFQMPHIFNYASMMWFRRNMVMKKRKNISKFIFPLTDRCNKHRLLGEVKKYWKIMTTPIDRLLSIGRDFADQHAADFKVISNGAIACNSAVNISHWMRYFSLYWFLFWQRNF